MPPPQVFKIILREVAGGSGKRCACGDKGTGNIVTEAPEYTPSGCTGRQTYNPDFGNPKIMLSHGNRKHRRNRIGAVFDPTFIAASGRRHVSRCYQF